MSIDKPPFSTLGEAVQYAEKCFETADLSYGHGTTNAYEEAAFLVLETLHLPINDLQRYWNKRLKPAEQKALADIIETRISTRKPAPYLVNRAYIKDVPFYVDERVIVPRSYLGELLLHEDGFSLIDDPDSITSALDLCTGSGCLAIIAAKGFKKAKVDAVDLSPEALAVARRNVKDHKLEKRIMLHEGDLFAPLAGKKYDLIITNPPYVDAAGMADLPPEYRQEPEMALAGGKDGLDLVRKILDQAPAYLNEEGALLCEFGFGREILERDYPTLPFLWLDTEFGEGEVFWVTREMMKR